MCILCVHTLLKVVGYYDLSVLSMSVIGFQKKEVCMWVGGVSSIQFVLDFWNFFNFARPLTQVTEDFGAMEVYCIVHSIDCIITRFFVRFCRIRSSWQRALQSTTFSSPTAC